MISELVPVLHSLFYIAHNVVAGWAIIQGGESASV